MKKILGAALALSLIGSAAFAEITVSGRGYVETQVFNYNKKSGSDEGTTSLFDNWNTDDSDVFVSGDINGIAGAMLNIDFSGAKNSGASDGAPVKVGDWNVWIKPLDFLTIKASNEANRVANRYNGIIDKTESKWGTLVMGGNYKDANDDDSFKGYQVNLDFGIVKVDLGFNELIQANGFAPASMVFNGTETVDVTVGDILDELPPDVGSMLKPFSDVVVGTKTRAYNSKLGFGARVVVPVEGLLNVDAFFKMGMTDYEEKTYNDETHMTFGAIFDIVAINNMGLALGYIGHYDDKGADGVLTSAVDVRFQYNLADNMGIALHNNATFLMPEGSSQFADKLNLGFMYGLTDVATLYIEVQNYMESRSYDGVDDNWMMDVVTVYPRFAFAIAEGVTMKTGLRADFGVTDDYKGMEIALPLSMEVIF